MTSKHSRDLAAKVYMILNQFVSIPFLRVSRVSTFNEFAYDDTRTISHWRLVADALFLQAQQPRCELLPWHFRVGALFHIVSTSETSWKCLWVASQKVRATQCASALRLLREEDRMVSVWILLNIIIFTYIFTIMLIISIYLFPFVWFIFNSFSTCNATSSALKIMFRNPQPDLHTTLWTEDGRSQEMKSKVVAEEVAKDLFSSNQNWLAFHGRFYRIIRYASNAISPKKPQERYFIAADSFGINSAVLGALWAYSSILSISINIDRF